MKESVPPAARCVNRLCQCLRSPDRSRTVGASLTLWAQQYATGTLGLSETQALAKAGVLLGLANGIALIGTPVIGITVDKLSRTDAVLIYLVTAAMGYTATIFIENPFSGLGYLVAVIIGLGQVSAVISTQVLIAEHAPLKTRGPDIGAYALCGGIGIMIAFAAGGTLNDNGAPPVLSCCSASWRLWHSATA